MVSLPSSSGDAAPPTDNRFDSGDNMPNEVAGYRLSGIRVAVGATIPFMGVSGDAGDGLDIGDELTEDEPVVDGSSGGGIRVVPSARLPELGGGWRWSEESSL